MSIVVLSVVMLISLWEYVIEPILFPNSLESYAERNEYILTSMIATVLALIYPSIDIIKYRRKEESLKLSLKETLKEVQQLKGYIPICANCKSIRNDEGFWEEVEAYIY